MMMFYLLLIKVTRFKYEYIFYEHIMNCNFCGNKLRKCKFELIENRSWHYKCFEKDKQKKYEAELDDFCNWFLQHGIIVKI